jgi:4'-phosphopantetheinyl transferase
MIATEPLSFMSGSHTAPGVMPLADTEVHLWKAHLRTGNEQLARNILSQGEWQRAARFRFDKDRARFLHSHVHLRAVLSTYVDSSPGKLEFHSGSNGKPTLYSPKKSVCFSLSHSGDCMLIAITRDMEIGVDVEKLRPVSHARQLARRYFPDDDCSRLDHLEGEALSRMFMLLWTRFEATRKMSGSGVFSTCVAGAETSDGHLISFEPEADYVACLALPEPRHLRCWTAEPLCRPDSLA